MATPIVLEYIENIRSAHQNDPELGPYYTEIADFYKRRLWHQLTEKLIDLIKLPRFHKGDDLITLYRNFIKDFEAKINQLKLAQIIKVVANQFANINDAIAFLQEIEKKVTNKEANIYIRSVLALFNLRANKLEETKDIVEETKTSLEGITGIDSLVYAMYYYAASEYYKTKALPVEFYKNGLLYLAYVALETLSDQEKFSLAFDLSLAALIGDSIYNFQELLGHQIVEYLKGENEWMVALLQAFNSGNMLQCQKVVKEHEVKFNAQPALVNNKPLLNQKLSILSLMELIFKRPSEERTIDFKTIAEATQLPLNEVELLVMKALSLKLVKGIIDEVDQKVQFVWVQPRVLDIKQVSGLKDRLATWATTVNQTLIMLEGETPELFV